MSETVTGEVHLADASNPHGDYVRLLAQDGTEVAVLRPDEEHMLGFNEKAGGFSIATWTVVSDEPVHCDLQIDDHPSFDAYDDEHWYDVVSITTPNGVRITEILVESSEESEPYDEAIRNAGFTYFTWI